MRPAWVPLHDTSLYQALYIILAFPVYTPLGQMAFGYGVSDFREWPRPLEYTLQAMQQPTWEGETGQEPTYTPQAEESPNWSRESEQEPTWDADEEQSPTWSEEE